MSRIVPPSISAVSSVITSPVKFAAPARELDYRVVDWTEFVQGLICHVVAFAFISRLFA